MSLLQPYSGRFVSAKSASDKIDAATIIAGCDSVDSEASEILSIGSKVNSAGSSITADALSFGGVTVAGDLGLCCDGIAATYANILGNTSQIRSTAMEAYNRIQTEYNEEARAKDEAAIAEDNAKNKRSE